MSDKSEEKRICQVIRRIVMNGNPGSEPLRAVAYSWVDPFIAEPDYLNYYDKEG